MAIKVLRKVTKEDLFEKLYHIDVTDKSLYEELNNPNSIGIFQMNGGLAGQLVADILPKSFYEAVAVNSLARPGTSGFAPQYKNNRDTGRRSYNKKVSDILEETYGILLYQEEAMAIFNKIGGFTLEETNMIRGVMKKLSKAEKDPKDVAKWDDIVSRFKKGAISCGLTEREATKITEDILMFSGYSFNKSHAVAYTYIAVINLYLSVYFQKYYFSAVLHYEVDRDKYLFDRLKMVRNRGFLIKQPDINLSSKLIAPVKSKDNELIFGLADIKYISEDIADVIINNRDYKSLFDFIFNTAGNRISSRHIDALVSVGAFDCIEPNRKKLKKIYEIYSATKGSTKVKEKLVNKFKEAELAASNIPFLETTQEDLMQFEKDYLGFNFFTSFFTEKKVNAIEAVRQKGLCVSSLKDLKIMASFVPVVLNSMRIFNDKNGREMAFIEIEDQFGEVVKIPIFQSFWKIIGQEFEVNKMYLIKMYLDDEKKPMFGKKTWVDSELEIRRFVKKIS